MVVRSRRKEVLYSLFGSADISCFLWLHLSKKLMLRDSRSISCTWPIMLNVKSFFHVFILILLNPQIALIVDSIYHTIILFYWFLTVHHNFSCYLIFIETLSMGCVGIGLYGIWGQMSKSRFWISGCKNFCCLTSFSVFSFKREFHFPVIAVGGLRIWI